jgi:hypothetical protein
LSFDKVGAVFVKACSTCVATASEASATAASLVAGWRGESAAAITTATIDTPSSGGKLMLLDKLGIERG